ncbi:unnamed protein product [Trypanosoma congolense IL3000]|uniref:WGS project CAEQ00000000 data, annotated contig 1905 n=1 Tax=Trypanosoma congolense (strain IL3000) TaxID=1068625 RepID=F9W9W3_TRYCI|nr:unnamed protein product [Trypanosoma congolense IL3000]
MSNSFAFWVTTIALIAFYVADFLLARLLNSLKDDHPELDECSPEETPDLDPLTVINSLQKTAEEMVDYQRRRFRTGEAGGFAADSTATVDVGDIPPMSAPSSHRKSNVMHTIVVLCGIAGPFVVVFEALLPSVFGWCRFDFPVFVEYIGAFAGLASATVYAGRVSHCSSYRDVTRSQWLELMWFRLDFMCLTSIAAFLGTGSWFVTVCLLAVGFYLAYRVMRIEKRVRALQLETQLVRGEVDVERVYVPGTAEAAQALGTAGRQGYDALK